MKREEIIANMGLALKEKQFKVFYQPQYDHTTKALVGAEALVRWLDPEEGLISPLEFISVFEEIGLISKLDIFVFEEVCRLQRYCIDNNFPLIPISVNASRYDIHEPNYLDTLEEIRKRYDVPVNLLRIEITESASIDGSAYVADIVKRMHDLGYLVEMDDFGSGYSSLNVLKDIPFDMIKMDMRFFKGEIGGRGGIIISSVARMAKWLGSPIIAEGVETMEQADYMLSIGCHYIQGYLYSKPVPEEEFIELLQKVIFDKIIPHISLIETMRANRFWSPESLETMMFSNYIGAAGIFTYKPGDLEFLRVNRKFLKEISMNMDENDVLALNFRNLVDEENRAIAVAALKKSISTNEETECELWFHLKSRLCGKAKLCIRAEIRVIGKIDDQYLFFCNVRNITKEKELFNEINASEKRFRAASEQAKIYAWEYNIMTKEMRPCFRCIRDLGLPPVVRNYPEPLIKSGIFPQDYADMYRDWMKQLENGVGTLEGVIPLTAGRVPFHVRYTTEFDAGGRPVKAFGSATLVIDEKDK